VTEYVDGADDVLGYLDTLAQLDDLLEPVTFTRFLDVVRAATAPVRPSRLWAGRRSREQRVHGTALSAAGC